MKTCRIQISVAMAAGLWAATAWANSQPWRAPNGAVESRIQGCTFNPPPLNRIAMDDFQYSSTTIIKRIRWWGVVLDPNQQQLTKRFYIAIWGNTTAAGPCAAGCNPTQVLNFWCLQPSYVYAGLDCQGRKVYRFSVCLPAPGFTAIGGNKYWLQVSEIDSESARTGVEDFRWSGYRWDPPVDNTRLCDAQQRTAAGVTLCTISDDCAPAVVTDLSYQLLTSCTLIPVPIPPVIAAPQVFLAEWRLASAPTSPPIMTELVEIDSDGQADLSPELPDGDYQLTLVGMAASRPKTMVSIMDGVAIGSFFDVFVGDLNNDGRANGLDTQILVDALLMP